MHVGYTDIIKRAGEPDWWDQNGTPRYGPFEPRSVTVYGSWVSLMLIRCQDCGAFMKVAKVWKMAKDLMWQAQSMGGPPEHVAKDEPGYEEYSKAFHAWWEEANKPPDTTDFHYGDPPNHGCVGDTMNSIPLLCLEHWKSPDYAGGEFEWARVAEGEQLIGADWTTQDDFDDIPQEILDEHQPGNLNFGDLQDMPDSF